MSAAGFNAAFGDFHYARWNAFHKFQRSIEIHMEGMEIAIIDANQVAAGSQGPVEFPAS